MLGYAKTSDLGGGLRVNTASLAVASVFVAYAALSWQAFSTTGPQVRFHESGDTIAYLRMAKLPVNGREFLAGERMFLYALLLKATRSNLSVAGYVQTIVSILSWGFLALTTRSLAATTLGKTVCFALVLTCALREEVLFWNSMSLSESLSLSCFALWVGSWLMFMRKRHWFWKLFPLVTSFLLASVRDTNAFLVLGAAILLAAASACRLASRWNLLTSLVLAAFFLGGIASRSVSVRADFSLQNNLGGRIFVDRRRTAELQASGMPNQLSQVGMAYLAGRCGVEFVTMFEELYFLEPSGAAALAQWVGTVGQRNYLAFLLRHPAYLLLQPFHEDGLLKLVFPLAGWVAYQGCSPPLRDALPPGFHTALPTWMTNLIRGENPGWFLGLWALTSVAAGLSCARHCSNRRLLLFPLALLLGAVPHLLVIWHGDALDLPRHALLAGIQVHLGFALALGLASDRLAELRRSRAAIAALTRARARA